MTDSLPSAEPCSSSMPDFPRERFLVLKGSAGAGLGDKVRAMVSAVVYARLTNRTLYVDWNDSACGDGTASCFEALFALEGVRTTSERPSDGRVRPEVWEGKLHLSWDRLYEEQGPQPWDRSWAVNTLSFDQGVLDWPEEVCVMWDFDQFHKLASYLPQRFPSIQGTEPLEWQQGEVLRNYIIPSSDVAHAVIASLEHLHAERPFIGIHVRASDESFQARSAPPVSAYIRAAKKMMRRSGSKTIFLATDNRKVQDLFRSEFGEKNVFWTEKWLPAPGVALHLENDCPDRLQSAKDALVDVCLLASADYLVTMNNSSFSILARMFSATPLKNRMTLMWRPPLWRRALLKMRWNPERKF